MHRILIYLSLSTWIVMSSQIIGFAESNQEEIPYQDVDAPRRLETDQMVSRFFKIEAFEITSENHQMQIRFSISNLDTNAQDILVTTAFIKNRWFVR